MTIRDKKTGLAVALALLCLFCFAVPGLAQSGPNGATAQSNPVSGWSAQLNTNAEQLKSSDLSDETLSQRRDELEAIRNETRKWIGIQAPNVERIKSELTALGKPPGKDEEPEAAGVAAQRQKVKTDLAEITGLLKEADLVVERASQLIAEIWQIRRDRFTDKILLRGPSPLSPAVWGRAFSELTWIVESFSRSTGHFLAAPQFQEKIRESIFVLLAAIIVAVVLVWPVHRWILRRYGRDPSIARPSYMRALLAFLAIGAARAMLPTLAAALIYFVAISQDVLTDVGREIAWAIFLSIVLFTWSIAFVRASLSPTYPNWRIVPVPTRFALGVRGIVIGLAFVFAADLVLSGVIAAYAARLAVTELRDYLLTVAVATLLLVLMLRQHMWTPDGELPERPRWRSARILFALGLFVVLIVGAYGYVALSRLIVTQVVITGGLALLVLTLHQLGRDSIKHSVSTETWVGEWLRSSLQLDDASAVRFEFWTGLAFDILLVFFAVVFALFVWGADRKDVFEWTYQALFGFKIGQINFSVVDLLIAAVLFASLVIVTRIAQRAMAERVLPHTQLDVGIRQSITTALGYIGIIIAAVIGVSALGLDLSNLAIVAGALSVGIGFGLQNVVNNFVSGLILLIERPVKVGDWVIVGDTQGYVKRIKVRATEIQTFDRASVFVPNSKLISDSVTNWTYGDKLGRVIIPVGVAYGSDTELVRNTLLAAARSHPNVLTEPRPSAVMRGFGDSSLNFELRCYLRDIGETIPVTSDLCLAIDQAFRTKGIVIPFPQQDVHLIDPVTLQMAKSAPLAAALKAGG